MLKSSSCLNDLRLAMSFAMAGGYWPLQYQLRSAHVILVVVAVAGGGGGAAAVILLLPILLVRPRPTPFCPNDAWHGSPKVANNTLLLLRLLLLLLLLLLLFYYWLLVARLAKNRYCLTSSRTDMARMAAGSESPSLHCYRCHYYF